MYLPPNPEHLGVTTTCGRNSAPPAFPLLYFSLHHKWYGRNSRFPPFHLPLLCFLFHHIMMWKELPPSASHLTCRPPSTFLLITSSLNDVQGTPTFHLSSPTYRLPLLYMYYSLYHTGRRQCGQCRDQRYARRFRPHEWQSHFDRQWDHRLEWRHHWRRPRRDRRQVDRFWNRGWRGDIDDRCFQPWRHAHGAGWLDGFRGTLTGSGVLDGKLTYSSATSSTFAGVIGDVTAPTP